jgi:hypothetical protein
MIGIGERGARVLGCAVIVGRLFLACFATVIEKSKAKEKVMTERANKCTLCFKRQRTHGVIRNDRPSVAQELQSSQLVWYAPESTQQTGRLGNWWWLSRNNARYEVGTR